MRVKFFGLLVRGSGGFRFAFLLQGPGEIVITLGVCRIKLDGRLEPLHGSLDFPFFQVGQTRIRCENCSLLV